MPEGIGFVGQAIKKILLENAAVSGVVVGRVFSPKAPESNNTWPIVVFRSVFPVVRDELFEEPGSSGLVRERIRVYSATKTQSQYESIKKLDRFVREALQGQRGIFVVEPDASPVVTVTIQGIFNHTVSGVDNTEERPDVLSVISDYDVWYEER